ncbi:MAG: ROK family protein [Pyrinomonadaceae bacterium]
MPNNRFLAIDLGGTKLAAAVFTKAGEMIAREHQPLDKAGRSAVGSQICDVVSRYSSEADSVGICVPGIYRHASGTVWAPNIPGWDDYPLRAEAQAAAGAVPVTIDSDRACYILGERWKGNAQGCTDAVFMAVGTGIGAGVLSGGHVVRGAHDIAGAVGWMALDRPYRNEYDACGCFESQCSGDGIAKVATALLRDTPEYSGSLGNVGPEPVTSRDVFAAFAKGDMIAERTIAQCVELWGMAAANLVSIFDPEKIIFGGGVFGPAVALIPRIRDEAAKWAQPIAMRTVEFTASALGTDAGIYGAGLLAKENAD